jgi:hypothetical protein
VGARMRSNPIHQEDGMKKLRLDVESLGVETFAAAPELGETEAEFIFRPSRNSCIEQCTTSCVP